MPLSVADKVEIMELTSRYNHAIDHQRAEEWADLFTEDGVFKVGDSVRAEGRAQFVAYVQEAKADGVCTRHWTSNAVIEGEGEIARLRLYVKAYNLAGGTLGAPYVMGEYDDTGVKVNGRWKFKLRHVRFAAGKSRPAS